MAALTLLALLLIEAAGDSQQISVTVAEVGHNVTFQCRVSEQESKFFYWNKESLGCLPQTIAETVVDKVTFSEQFKGSRFSVTKDENLHFLTIINVTKDDEATYFCQAKATYGPAFVNGTFLSVTDRNQQKRVHVTQHPKVESVQPGDSVTMECSLLSNNSNEQCPAEHSVFWFRAGSGGFRPGVIYTHRDTPAETSCVYRLSKTIQDSSDAGVYYCAVVTCGQILFGEGTTVEPPSRPLVAVLGGLLVCCGAVITILICCITQRKACVCKGSRSDSRCVDYKTPTEDQSNNLVDEASAVNYAAVDFSTRRVTQGTMKASPQESFYSVVRANQR